jgi:DHA1 family tetracycline resistance protein-like MFS transporter
MASGAGPLRALLPLYGVIFVGFLGYSLMITVFTPMLLHGTSGLLAEDASPAHRNVVLGVVLMLYPAGQFFGSPAQGALSDRVGRRPVLLASLAMTTLCYAAIAWSLAAHVLWLLCAASVLAGLAESNVATAQAAIADTVAPAARGRWFGYIYMCASLAYVVGPLGGGWLAGMRHPGGDAAPFWAMLVLLAATTAATALWFRETRRGPAAAVPARRYAAAFARPHLRQFLGINFLLYLAIFGFFRAYPMYLVGRFGLGVAAVSRYVAWVGVPIVLANAWLTGALSARFDLRTLTIGSAALTGICVAAVVLPSATGWLWPLLFCAGAALAVCLPTCATRLSQAAADADEGIVMGSNQALQVAAEALSGLASGLLAAAAVTLPLFGAGAVALVAAALAGWLT